jgi:TPR repeat protein
MLQIRRITVVVTTLLLATTSPASADEPLKATMCRQLPQLTIHAQSGDPQAQATLSKLSHGGWCGIAKDDVKAAKWAELSAGQGNAEGEGMLALLFNRGLGVTRDDVEAMKWARLSAEQGNVPGQDYLALMLHHGWGAPKDDVEAIKWARLSAGKGDAQGEGLLALILAEEPTAPKDDVEAAKWARLSAEQDHNGGQFVLGAMYSMGRGGLPRDYIEADKWYLLSGRTNEAVANTRKPLEALMSKEDIAEANRRADAWKPKPEAQKQ